MPKSRHRKNHKQKVQARRNEKANQMAHIKNLTKQLNTAIASAKQPEPNVSIGDTKITLPGQNKPTNYEEF